MSKTEKKKARLAKNKSNEDRGKEGNPKNYEKSKRKQKDVAERNKKA